jgi:hypothetical protein
LIKAVILDLGFRWLSNDVEQGQHGLPSVITSIADVNHIFEYFRYAILPHLRLWEYYAIDVLRAERELTEALKSDSLCSESRVRMHSSVSGRLLI